MNPDLLNTFMEFDHVIRITEDGEIAEGVKDVYAPNLHNNELDDESWTLMDGYSRQDSYSGPVMHDSEYIGGQMARDILDNPGYYVAIVSFYDGDSEEDDQVMEGWAVASKSDC